MATRRDRLLLDSRVAGGVLLGACAAGVIAHLIPLPAFESAARLLLPAAIVHVALTFPQLTTLARFAPGSVLPGYAVGAVLAGFALRARASQPEAESAAEALSGALIAIATLGLLLRLTRFALGRNAADERRASRIALAGALVSALALLAWAASSNEGLLVVGALVSPVAVLAMAWPNTRGSPESPAGSAAAVHEAGISVEQVARGIAHAMLKPVAASSEQLRRVGSQLHGSRLQQEIGEAVELMDQLERLVRDLLELGRSQRAPEKRNVGLAKLADQAAAAVKVRFRDAVLEVDAEGSVWADEVSLRRLLVELIENALEASSDPGWVAVRTSIQDKSAEVIVEDRAGGIAADVVERIFEPFVTTKARGTGLGLSVVHETARAHGGRVRAEATLGGTRFVVSLPRGAPRSAPAGRA